MPRSQIVVLLDSALNSYTQSVVHTVHVVTHFETFAAGNNNKCCGIAAVLISPCYYGVVD